MDDDDETIYVPLPFFFFSTPDIALPFVMLEEYCEKNGKKIVFGDVVDADGNRTFTIVDKIKVSSDGDTATESRPL